MDYRFKRLHFVLIICLNSYIYLSIFVLIFLLHDYWIIYNLKNPSDF